MGTVRATSIALCVIALASAGCGRGHAEDACATAYQARKWRELATQCAGPRRALGRVWLEASAGHRREAIELADGLAGSAVAIDALYLAGYILGSSSDDGEQAVGRVRLWQALVGYQALGDHADASRVAGALSRCPRPSAPFADALAMAELAQAEATLGGDPVAIGRAETALAEIYDGLGMREPARDAFIRAEGQLTASLADLAFAYLKHALFLIDVATSDVGLRTGLRYLDVSEAYARQAEAAGSRDVDSISFAVHLNRADALVQLGRLDEAARTLDEVTPHDDEERRKLALVRGYIAARRRDLPAAESLFTAADDGALELDYRWRVAMEVAELHHGERRLREAESAYGEAIAAVEKQRDAAGSVELRPWVVARRARPYVGLLRVLVEEGRGPAALAVAESLHARSWLDAVLGAPPPEGPGDARAIRDARVSARFEPVRALDEAALMAKVGDREALVFVTVDATIWRAHVAAGAVTFTSLSDEDAAAVEAFRRSPAEPLLAERAARALLPPALASSDRPLYVVAGGPLADLPFAALRRDGRFLIEERPLARLPGLAALGCRSRTWSDRRIFVGDARGDLPRAADEVRRLGGADARTGTDATIAAVTGARDAAVLHAAVHGRSTAGGGAIELADGVFTAADVLDLELAPREVVLTGCATAASDDAEAWDGFPSAFLAAGSRHVVATLSSVADADAAAFARAYYAQPAELGPVLRVAAAQRLLARTEPVLAWSSFTVWGDADCAGR